MNKRALYSFIPAIFFTFVIAADIICMVTNGNIALPGLFRELGIVVACSLLFPRIRRTRWIEDENVTNKIKALFLTIICIYVLFFALSSFGPYPAPENHSPTAHFQSWPLFFMATVSSILTTLFGINILLLLRDLIYFRRTRTTHRNFRVLLYIGLAQLIFLNWTHFERDPISEISDGGPLSKLLLILFIMMVVINSFRSAWVNHLNKKQKIAWFLWGLLMLPAAYAFFSLKQHEIILQYSITLSIFIKQIAIFLAVYWSLAMLSVLMHLPTAGLHDQKRHEIASLHKLSRTFTTEFDLNRLIVLITQQSSEVIEANGVWLETIGQNSTSSTFASAHYLTPVEIDVLRSHSNNDLSQWIIHSRQPVIISETKLDKRTAFLQLLPRNFGSLVGVPMLSKDKLIGILYAVKLDVYGFYDDQLNMLHAFADQAAIALENAYLISESIQKERLEQELQIAHEAQMKLLPKTMPQMIGLDVDAMCVTANEVGGDYYDFFSISDHQIAVVVGDVSGKGPEAAFYMAEVKGIIESLSRTFHSPKDVLIHANSILHANLEKNMFVTLLYAVVDLKTDQITFSRSGHCPLLHISSKNDMANYIEPKGLGLGLDSGDLFSRLIEEVSIPFHDKDVCILFTDGIVEAQNTARQEFGENRLRNLAKQYVHMNAAQIRSNLIDDVHQFIRGATPHDDLTICVLRRTI